MNGYIIVTGGLGYIGSHTVVELWAAGYIPIIVDNLSNAKIEILDGIEKIIGHKPIFEEVDCRNKASLGQVCTKYDGIKGVIHFAASKSVSESVQLPLMYYRNNLVSLLHVLELIQEYQISSFVFSSSCTVYGQPESLPENGISETSPILETPSPYGHTKQMCETMIRDVMKTNPNFKTIILRYFNPIGAHESGYIGEIPRGTPQNLVPLLTQTAIGLRNELLVYGHDYKNTPDGTCVRDYINVVDLAKAHVCALSRMLSDSSSLEVFNIGTGRRISVLELIHCFERATGVKVPYRFVAKRPGDIEQIWADASLANEVLKWKAETTIEETLKSAWNWQLKSI